MARIELTPEGQRTPEEERACAEAVAGIRGRVPAPMIAWLKNPELASRAQKLGELLRYQTSLEPRYSELAILVMARHWTAHYEWFAHKRIGLEAGMDPQVVADIAARRVPTLRDDKEQAIYDVATTLLATRRVPRPLYDRAVSVLGEKGLVELIGVLGYYSFVSMTLNTFELGLPENFQTDLGAEPGDEVPV